MSDPLERISELKRAVEQARSEQARLEAKADQAEAVEKEALSRLEAMGFNSLEAAEQAIPELQHSLDERIVQIESMLKKVGL